MILLNLEDRRIHDLNRKIKEHSELFDIESDFKYPDLFRNKKSLLSKSSAKLKILFLICPYSNVHRYFLAICYFHCPMLMAINSKHTVLNQIRLFNCF